MEVQPLVVMVVQQAPQTVMPQLRTQVVMQTQFLAGAEVLVAATGLEQEAAGVPEVQDHLLFQVQTASEEAVVVVAVQEALEEQAEEQPTLTVTQATLEVPHLIHGLGRLELQEILEQDITQEMLGILEARGQAEMLMPW